MSGLVNTLRSKKKKRRCNHSAAEKVRPGVGTTEYMSCKVCKKVIIKGKAPKRKNGCFGKAKVLWEKR